MSNQLNKDMGAIAFACILFAFVLTFTHYFNLKTLRFEFISMKNTSKEVIRLDHMPSTMLKEKIQQFIDRQREFKIKPTKEEREYFNALKVEYRNRKKGV